MQYINNLKVIVYFSGNIEEPKGTPIRVKNVLNELLKNGADVHYCGPVCPKNFEEKKFLNMGSPYLRPIILARYARMHNIDIIYIQTSAGLWLAPILQILTRAKVALDFHSLIVEEEKVYNNLGWLRYNFLKLIDYGETYFLDFATGVSYKLADYYKKVLTRYHVLPGGVDTQVFNAEVTPNAELLRWKGDSTLIGYAGNTKWYQGLDTVLSALDLLEKKAPGKFKLFIVASSLDASIEDFIRTHGLEASVKLLGKHDHKEMPSLLMSADVLTVVRPSDMVTEYAFPSKFPEYLALGKAVVFSRVGDIERYVQDHISAAIVNPSNPNELCDRLEELQDPIKRNILGKGALEVVRTKLDINVIGTDLYNFLKETCKTK